MCWRFTNGLPKIGSRQLKLLNDFWLVFLQCVFSHIVSISEVQLFPIHFNSCCFRCIFFLQTKLIADWHTIGRSTIYGVDDNNKMKQKKICSSFRFFFFWACVSRDASISTRHEQQQNAKSNLSNRMQNSLSFYGLNENGVYVQRCWSNNCHLLESKFYLHANFHRILFPIWWETKLRTLVVFFVRRYSRPFDIFHARQIWMRSSTPAFLSVEKFAPQKNKYTIKNITILSHSPQVI